MFQRFHCDVFERPGAIKDFLRLQTQGLPHEMFAVLYLDARKRLIGYEPLFRGPLTCTSAHRRAVVKEALVNDAASVVLHHNNPGAACSLTVEDALVTLTLKATLDLVDVQVLDYIVTSDEAALSMAECGMIGAGLDAGSSPA